MGQGFLIDTNIVIATLGNKLPLDGEVFIKTIPPKISVIIITAVHSRFVLR
jgi:hypothetical protein